MIFHDFLISQALEPRIYGFYYTKILQKILESIWEHPGKYYFYIYGLQKNVKFGKDGHRKMMKIRPRIS